MTEDDYPTVPQLLREYAAAIRGDWGTIDGRAVRDDLEALADWDEHPDDIPLNARERLGICTSGFGHWDSHCAASLGCVVEP